MPYPQFKDGKTVTIVRRVLAGKDEYGNDMYTETTEDIPGCSVQPAGSSENVSFNDQVISGVVVYFPYGTNIGATDAIQIGNIEYEVTGDPSSWMSSFSGNTAPIEVRARRVTGASA
jgi:hypothetical protein